jgi:hypothetical protein
MALFIKKEYKIEREISINKSRQEVFDYVKLIKNQDYYSKWVMTDPQMKKDFRGTDGTVGFVYAWDSENKDAGKGEQEITKVVEGTQLDCEIRFERPMEAVATTHMFTDSIATNQTKVLWAMEGKSPYPFNLMNLFMDGILGKDMETSLTTLKSNIEK